MDLGFIRRSIGIALGLTGLAFLGLLLHSRPQWAWGVGSGSVWSCANWMLIMAVMRLLLTKERRLPARSKIKLALIGVVKFPLLYGAGYLLLRQGLPALALLAGFWVLPAVVTARAAGRLITGVDAVALAGGPKRSEGESA
ncbi:MAG: hypothetical protein KAW17_04320 [Candidatus Eisenbacteria sp.]|nr:hypothetical protein [Candidatus Eisenbacteria bacterium]